MVDARHYAVFACIGLIGCEQQLPQGGDIQAIVPDRIRSGRAVSVQITVTGLIAPVVDLSSDSPVRLPLDVTVRIGGVNTQVNRVATEAGAAVVHVEVPATLGVGGHAVEVESAHGLASRPEGIAVYDPYLTTPHLPGDAKGAATGDLIVDSVVIDTDALEIVGRALPAGVTFEAAAQEPSGPELAVLRAVQVQISPAAVVRVIGSRPLLVVASGSVEVAGVVDAGAHLDQPGAGGAPPESGSGAGMAGIHSGATADGGGGGAGFGTAGAVGGDALCTKSGCTGTALGGAGGPIYGDLDLSVLVGGSGGGPPGDTPTSCGRQSAGAGGGAIQLSSVVEIRIEAGGGINVGGGGGGTGLYCPFENWGGASGGGSGGAIYLHAPRVINLGTLAANGGGGGGGTGEDNTQRPGCDGTLDDQPACGGRGGGFFGSAGGVGGSAGTAPEPGTVNRSGEGNGGGGGAAVGRVVVVSDEYQAVGISSPAANVLPP
jgi:hypothetical protein